jgi:hypothetical protein
MKSVSPTNAAPPMRYAMSAGVCPGTRMAVASMVPMRKVSPSMNRWSNWLPSGKKLRSRL